MGCSEGLKLLTPRSPDQEVSSGMGIPLISLIPSLRGVEFACGPTREPIFGIPAWPVASAFWKESESSCNRRGSSCELPDEGPILIGSELIEAMNMKQILLIGGGTAFGAIAAVVIMKAQPTGEESAANPESTAPSKVAAVAPDLKEGDGQSDQKPAAGNILEQIAEANPELDLAEFEGRRDEFRSAMRERQMERLTSKMAKWSAALGLEEGQREKLLELADAHFEELETLEANAEGGDSALISDSAKRAMAIMSGRALEESMAELLTPSQKATYQEFGERQDQSRAEARTLRQLAGLQEDLMLTPEQRNDVYGVLYENSLTEVQGKSDVSSLIESFASQAGVTLDPALQGVISGLADRGLEGLASGQALDRESIEEFAKGAVNESVEQQVEQLRPVLTEDQLELYRNQLEGRVGNLLRRGQPRE
jgi:hypothetical protein